MVVTIGDFDGGSECGHGHVAHHVELPRIQPNSVHARLVVFAWHEFAHAPIQIDPEMIIVLPRLFSLPDLILLSSPCMHTGSLLDLIIYAICDGMEALWRKLRPRVQGSSELDDLDPSKMDSLTRFRTAASSTRRAKNRGEGSGK